MEIQNIRESHDKGQVAKVGGGKKLCAITLRSKKMFL